MRISSVNEIVVMAAIFSAAQALSRKMVALGFHITELARGGNQLAF